MPAPLTLTRDQILAFRRRTSGLDERLPRGAASLRAAGWAGLQDSMPRAALLSIHARVAGTEPSTWDDPALVQIWGPRFNTYVVPAVDHAIFALGTYPDDAKGQRKAEDLAERLHAVSRGTPMLHDDAGAAVGVHPNALRYAAATGRVLIRWGGARQALVWTVPAPALEPKAARRELARRHLHVFGPTTAESFAGWAGLGVRHGLATFAELDDLVAVRTPVGEAWILAADEPILRAPPATPAAARLLPSGDTFFLLQGADRDLLLPDPDHRGQLWTSRVWPGALLVDGDVVGTWRRAGRMVTAQAWRRLSASEEAAVEAEAATLPLPDLPTISVRWID